jgi:hypothetical protein
MNTNSKQEYYIKFSQNNINLIKRPDSLETIDLSSRSSSMDEPSSCICITLFLHYLKKICFCTK